MNIEVDDVPGDWVARDLLSYNDIIIQDMCGLHLLDGINCKFFISDCQVKIDFTGFNNQIGFSEMVFTAILHCIANKRLSLYFYPVWNIKLQDNGNIILETKFKANVLREVLCAPWLLNGYAKRDFKNKHFIVDRTGQARETNLLHGSVDITWPLNGNANEINYFSPKIRERYRFINDPGKNIFFITSSNTELVSALEILRPKIQKEFLLKYPGQLDSFSSFYYVNMDEKSKLKRGRFINHDKSRQYTLAYSNYYPNKEVCKVIKILMSPFLNVQLVNTGEIANHSRVGKTYDMCLEIGAPAFFSDCALPLSMFPDLMVGKTEENIRDIFQNCLNKGPELFSRTRHNIPIFRSRNIFWVSKALEEVRIDKFGRIGDQSVQ